MSVSGFRKRSQQGSPPPWQRAAKDHRREGQESPGFGKRGHAPNHEIHERKEQESFAREQTRLNQIQEAEQMREWVSKEDDFVLQQSKKKAHIRVKEGRAKSIDWLAVTLGVIDPTKDLLEDEEVDADVDVVDPAGIFEGLNLPELQELAKDINAYVALESNSTNRRYWKSLKAICSDYQAKLSPSNLQRLASSSVSADVERLLSPKTLKELEILETQIAGKLNSNEPIDVEYWEQLLRNVEFYKARAELHAVYKTIIESRLNALRQEQRVEAALVKEKLTLLLHDVGKMDDLTTKDSGSMTPDSSLLAPALKYSTLLDPEPLLKLRVEDKGLDVLDEKTFMEKNAQERQRVLKLRYVPLRQAQPDKRAPSSAPKAAETPVPTASRFAPSNNEDFSSATKALYEREVARGVQEDEEIFAGEEEVSSISKPQWANKYRPRKPRYFNRVQMGYEWNKYNQTHYDHENPPPKVVQGYKFNIFYPDLIDKVKAPTYRIERENGRKRGESFAPAGEEDTCLIRFISGPPYEDLAFRIVDKEWDYSAKRERGFRSSFDKGILQLHFQFKKVYYRK
ncbi:cactin, partial [Lecanoromycetidae sp. Uapishka_2]